MVDLRGPRPTDEYAMPFGKYEGRPIGKVPAEYLDWCSDQDWIHKFPLVVQYIEENRDILNEELEGEDE